MAQRMTQHHVERQTTAPGQMHVAGGDPRWRRRVQPARNSLSLSGDSVVSGGRVVAELLPRARIPVAVSRKRKVEAVPSTILVRVTVERHDESPAIGVTKLNGNVGRR